MRRSSDIVENEITHSVVRDAILQIMRGDVDRAGSADINMATDVAARITPSVQKMGFRGPSSAVLSGNAAFHTMVTQHLGSPAAADYNPLFRQQLLQAIEKANITGSDFIAGVKVGLHIGLQHAALREGRSADAESGQARRSGQPDYGTELATAYTRDNLPASMRSLVDAGRGVTAAHVAEVANFAQRIGIQPGPYAGYFTGSSQSVRTAIERHVKSGDKITDDHLKNPNDVKAVLGAIKAGKMKKEDAPPAMQKIIEDMEKKGVNTLDPKAVDQYLDKNKDVLEKAKQLVKQDQAAVQGMSDKQLTQHGQKLAAQAAQTAPTKSTPERSPSTGEKPKPSQPQTVPRSLL